LKGLTLTHGQVLGYEHFEGSGGAILVNIDADLTVVDSIVASNSARLGGGIDNNAGSVTLSNSTLIGNSASVDGGGLRNVSGMITLDNSTLTGNASMGYNGWGGGICNVYGAITMAAWIRANAADEWVRFKTETITSLAWEIMMAVRAVKTSIRINLHTVPWRTDDFGGAITRIAGQDRAALGGLADSLSPMCYSFMLHRAPKWISSVVADAAEVGNCPVLPSIQVAEHYRSDSSFDVKEFEACVRAALDPPSAGVVFWKWDHIAADPARADAIRKVIREVHRPSVPDSG